MERKIGTFIFHSATPFRGGGGILCVIALPGVKKKLHLSSGLISGEQRGEACADTQETELIPHSLFFVCISLKLRASANSYRTSVPHPIKPAEVPLGDRQHLVSAKGFLASATPPQNLCSWQPWRTERESKRL